MDRTWTVEVEGKKHLIELDYPVVMSVDDDSGEVTTQPQDGKLVVDGNQIHTFKPLGGVDNLPKEISFEIGGKVAALRRKGFFSSRLELFFEGRLIKPAK